jgi:hypothetical protein
METELLYFGNDIKRYQKSFSENPYTNQSYQAHLHNEQQTLMQEQQAAEAATTLQLERLDAAKVGKPRSLSTRRIQENAEAFKKTFSAFLAAQSVRLSTAKIDTTEVANLGPRATPAIELGRKLRQFDEDIQASDDLLLRQEWLAASATFR